MDKIEQFKMIRRTMLLVKLGAIAVAIALAVLVVYG